VLWHGIIGLGSGLLYIPIGPPSWLVALFLVSSLTIIVGVRFSLRRPAWMGLAGMTIPLLLRAIIIWSTGSLPPGNRALAIFVWTMLGAGAAMEGYSVKHRGIA